ncbi:hypothetical protein OTK01_000403 [Caldicellulosiruptor acetigenus]|uniref:hypothetical protein n=1 Tax=Caldicellulosiruptor acetigenus TaxID=301953 RepID=UPI0022A95DF7|nr:hypothetical protein [Caldicellulosiruptor acetigenus]WAM36627.1 hypothetical protein OTK01_000403 [Caldicellulosiruptor acetigenus]
MDTWLFCENCGYFEGWTTCYGFCHYYNRDVSRWDYCDWHTKNNPDGPWVAEIVNDEW